MLALGFEAVFSRRGRHSLRTQPTCFLVSKDIFISLRSSILFGGTMVPNIE